MTAEERLAKLERSIRYLTDRQEVLDCVARNARGCDRHDAELLSSTYHADGIDEHGLANIHPGPEYHEWANEVHSRGSLQNMHHITTHSCEIDGDVAHAESYVIGLFLNTDGVTARLLTGRYVDRLERRDGEWRIALRRCTVEVIMQGDASILKSPYIAEMGFLKGLRNRQDVSYERPLSLDETPPGHRW
jgi:SnoaL-like domain